MIPLKLQIKNFTSYGSKTQTINFEPYNLICLSGKNGHGKSALLDALTWTIWGQARKVSGSAKADEGLLRLGETNMMTCLDFKSNGSNYRIRREYTLGNTRSHANLEFGIIDPQTQSFKPLTDKTIKATQNKIEKMIGLDYESFINSAFLRQGQSNEFSKKSPKDRKEILASILGLDKFEKLKKLASEKARNAMTEKEYKSQLINQISDEIAQKSEIQTNSNNINELLSKHSHEESFLKNELKNIKHELENSVKINSKIQQLEFEKKQLEQNINEKKELLLKDFFKWREVFRNQKKVIDYKKVENEHESLKKQLNILQINASKRIELKEKIFIKKENQQKHLNTLKEKYHTEQEKLKSFYNKKDLNLNNVIEKLKELSSKKIDEENEKKAIENELSKFQNSVNTIKIISLISSEEKQLEKRKSYYHKYIADGNSLKNEIKKISQRKTIIQSEHANCPLCQQNLSNQHKNFLCKNFEKQESFLNHQLKRITRLINSLKELLINQHKNIEKLNNQVNEEKISKIKKEQLEKDLLKKEISLKTLNSEINQLELLQKQEKKLLEETDKKIQNLKKEFEYSINNDNQLLNIQKEISILESGLKQIGYNESEENNLKQKIKKLEEIKNQQSNMLQDIALQSQRKQNVSNLCKQAKSLKKIKSEKENELKKYLTLNNKKEIIESKEKEINIKIERLLEEKTNLIHKKGALEQQIINLEKKEKELLEQKKIIKNLELIIEEYKAIVLALSKDGIQALLIEDAIPEIENEANILLARLTDNQAHLTIDSLKDLRKGGTKETLDIKISDAMGIRPYEMFSGGEAFRIDFALRIAISKLLARRAGTALQTLIIDEGFGSQDEEGLASIMQALYKIQGDFSKIIIVSHLSSLKEQFPVNFLIQKSPHGSTVQIMQQG